MQKETAVIVLDVWRAAESLRLLRRRMGPIQAVLNAEAALLRAVALLLSI